MGERGDHPDELCPYQGLAPFEAGMSELFFGRAHATRNLLERLGKRLAGHGTILLVSGASGVGKSSLLRAGLIPEAARGELPGAQRWRCLLTTPTAQPFRALAHASGRDEYASGRDEYASSRDECASDRDRGAVAERLRNDPERAMAATLRPGERLLLVVDQFEELFTLVTDERERQAFVAALHALADGPDGAAVVIGVRADYWDRCAAYPQFAEAIQDGQAIVEPMTESDLRLAITGPATAAGLTIEPGLVELILDELRAGRAAGDRYEAGALPLLSQALRNTWERRAGRMLTIRGYEESGRVRDSVRRTADEVLDRLSPEDRRSALRIFRRLTLITAGGQVARRRARLAEIHAAASAQRRTQPETPAASPQPWQQPETQASPQRHEQPEARAASARPREHPETQATPARPPARAATTQPRDQMADLLSAFADRRLLTLHEDTVEIAHDALLTAWPTLRQWLEPDLAAQSVYDRLLEAATQWSDHHRDQAFLYRGARLLAVQDSRPRWDRDPDSFPPPGPVVEAFLAASTSEARRAGRRRRLAVSGLALLAVLALAAAATAVNAAGEADRQRRLAISRQLAAQSEVTGDVPLSSLLAVAAWKIAGTDEARNRVLSAATRTGRGNLTGHTRGVMSLAFSADGSIVATGSDDGTARLWDTATRRQLGAPITRARFDCSSVQLALSPDGRTLATACLSTVRFYDVATRREVGSPLEHEEVVSALAYSPDGRTVVTGDFRGVTRQWDAATHRPHGPPMGRPDHGRDLASIVRRMAFTRDGRTLAVASGKSVRLWDPATSRPRGAPIAAQRETVLDFALSPDGGTLATVSFDNAARLWSMRSGKQTGVIRDRNTGFNAIVFSPDGTRLATGGRSGRTVLWDTASRRQLVALADNVMGVERVAFSPDGKLLAAASDDGVVRLADPQVHLQIGRPVPAESAVALSPDGRVLATGIAGRPGIQLWDVATQRPLGPPLSPEGARRAVAMIDFTADGRTLVSSSLDGLWLWDVATRRELAHDATLSGVNALSPDGRFVAVQHEQGIVFWDVATRRRFGPHIRAGDHTGVITGMAISPDGRLVASAGFDSRLRIFEVATGRELGGNPPAVAAGLVNDLAFSPDGRTLAYTAADAAVRLWDVPRRRPAGIALIAEDDTPAALAFSPDGEILATGTSRGDVLLWDLRTHRPLGTPMTGHTSGVTALAYQRDGTAVATVAGDGTARLWNAGKPADLVGAACANAGRSLTREEWRSLVPQEEYRPTCP
ncbi:WD40 repeat domain-containing protein [Nonomuraea gerenzanensis]|nr:WD40 repeat domain-containing protein [Nonomuraea gerenzanensis]UBU09249.1 AAA family ATPase [Nonomuraea gerenzanensis]